ncbi:ATP-dependent DNA helicase [Mycena crocata]|nr:ATP-dependent DNA helicase [Mycena crocata]
MDPNSTPRARTPSQVVHDRYNAIPAATPMRTPDSIAHNRFDSPGNPLAPLKTRKLHRNGYEYTAKTPSYVPFALNNPGTPRQQAFNISKTVPLKPMLALDPSQWNDLAVKTRAIPAGGKLRSFQIEISNHVLMRNGDGVVISSTGSGKSLTWKLPLLARKEGISLVVTPYTSLGLEGELSNDCDGISSLFIYSEKNTSKDFELAATGEMLVIYVCPEMLESPSFARLTHSKLWQGRLSAIYIDEAHLVHETHDWRPPYARIHLLRNIVGHDKPVIALSATCPKLYRDSLVKFVGLHPDYHLINLGNYRPELSTIIVPMQHDANSFLDIAFVLPLGCRESDLKKNKTLIYSDDLELLTDMFWWGYQRAASMGIPTHVIDIIHSGLSARHQEMALEDFRTGKTSILLGSSKISAGVNFPGVRRVIQYKVRGLTIPGADQRRGRGARRRGETAVGIFFVEPSMWPDAISMENPGDQDRGIIELVQSKECTEVIIQRNLGNPPHERHHSCDCCNRCDPTLRPDREYQWIEVNPSSSTQKIIAVTTTDMQRDSIYDKLVQWRLQEWKWNWRDSWPSYGPKTLIPDSDLEDLAKHTSKIFCAEDMRQYTHIVHWSELSIPLFGAIQDICRQMNILPVISVDETIADQPEPKRRRKTAVSKKPVILQHDEMIIDF